jgi:hypothetical protein
VTLDQLIAVVYGGSLLRASRVVVDLTPADGRALAAELADPQGPGRYLAKPLPTDGNRWQLLGADIGAHHGTVSTVTLDWGSTRPTAVHELHAFAAEHHKPARSVVAIGEGVG